MTTIPDDILELKRLLAQEREARKKAEAELEEKSYSLYVLNERLKNVNKLLEDQVAKRTQDMKSLARMPLENPEPVLRIDFEGKIIFCNEAINKIASDLQVGEDRYSFDQFWEYIALNVCETYTQKEIEAETGTHYFSFTCVPLKEEGYINIYGRSITSQKNIEHTLKATASRLTTIISSIQSAILVVDETDSVLLVNQMFCDYFDIPLSPNQLIGMDAWKMRKLIQRQFDDFKVIQNQVGKLVEERQVILDIEMETKDGRVIERDYIPILDNKEYLGSLWKFQDITIRKKNQALLEQSEEKYRNIIENMNLGLIEVDLQERIAYANQSFCLMTGYTPKELIGKKTTEIFFRENRLGEIGQNLERIQSKKRKAISDAYEICIKNKEGNDVWLLISGAPLFDDNKNFIGTIGIHLDITDQKQMEKDLRDAISKAQASVKAKEIFLANMSHEIRTPMNAILGMSRLLHKTPLNEQQISFLKAITTSAENLLVIINDILDFSKIEAGKMQMEHVDFTVKDILKQVSDIIVYKAEEKGLHIKTHIDNRISKALKGDPYRLNQILLNLAGNAVKFTHQGSVKIETRLLTETENSQCIEFIVSDTGIGIEKEKQSDIFKSFTQEDNSVTRKFGGTGLGLSICKRLIELMGGSISVFSEKGKGTTMTFTLTFEIGNSETLEQEEKLEEAENMLPDRQILLVEDNEFNRMLAITVLSNQGAIVTEAVNGLDAVQKVQKKDFDLILMDIQMPEMNGFEATSYIRSHLNKQTPIIALTANAIKGEKERCLEVGMNDYLSKPFEEKDLIHRCSVWLFKKQSTMEIKVAETLKTQEKLYDLSQLQFISRGDKNFVCKMIQLFINSSSEAVNKFKSYHKNREFDRFYSLAHQLKPNIENMGISSLRDEIREIEQISHRNYNLERLDYLMSHFEEVIIQINQELYQELEHLKEPVS
ncbi:PAS domain S-box protein [Cytophagaceae bacterium YF14B1]|uniref:Sensory/regulatory protein RpfC n=1 Tax=Xanthocytophaga flava TaxID=3048013 RepID=A0AAE3QHW9_9BACT|nr:PAS domain S-box protein [Xanthocytophaga flavus]MDJ1479662.1 PAS domain S-box protein [Xanthocytophaga flavus]